MKLCYTLDCTPKKLLFFSAVVFCVTSPNNGCKGDYQKAGCLFFLLPMSKKVLHQPWNALTLQFSLSVRDRQEICLLCMFISPEAMVINLFAILRLFVGLAS